MKQESRKHINWIDIARTIAILCVVLNHAVEESFSLQTAGNSLNGMSHISQLFVYTVFTLGRVGVPIFLMISGYLLIDRNWNEQSCISFWKKNWLRLLICTQVWWFIYEVFVYFYLNEEYTIWYILQEHLFIRKISLSHVWYMTVILGVYILIPFVGMAFEKIGTKLLAVPLIFYTVYIYAFPVINVVLTALGKDKIIVWLSYGYSGGEFGLYLIWGYLIKKNFFARIKSRYLLMISALSFILTVGLQMWSLSKGIHYSLWYDNGLLLVSCVTLMIFLARIQDLPVKLQKTFSEVAKCSFGIYLIHELALLPIVKLFINSGLTKQFGVANDNAYNSVICTTFSFVCSFVISLIIAAIMRRVPKLKALI